MSTPLRIIRILLYLKNAPFTYLLPIALPLCVKCQVKLKKHIHRAADNRRMVLCRCGTFWAYTAVVVAAITAVLLYRQVWPFEHECARVWEMTDTEIDHIVDFWDDAIFGDKRSSQRAAAKLGYVRPATESYFERLERGRSEIPPDVQPYFRISLKRFIKHWRHRNLVLSVDYEPNDTFREFLASASLTRLVPFIPWKTTTSSMVFINERSTSACKSFDGCEPMIRRIELPLELFLSCA